MDTGNTVKPVTGVVASDYARPAASAGQTATPTDLPEAKAVSPPSESVPAQNHAPTPHASGGSGTDYISHNFVIDPQSREVIYRVMDMRTRQVLWQVPDVALLRNRAYAQSPRNNTRQPANTDEVDVTE
jgi:hypothetical protein